jgi:acyl-CoA reductase-like NAD-dependent aldehyde dehydrogenase
VQELCASRSLPLQAELGGNNAAIVTSGAERHEAARRIVAGAFGFAGQRCTANRRVIVPDQDAGRWIEALIAAATDLPCGDPRDERTLCGPLVSAAAARRTAELVARCDVSWSGAALPHADYFPPTIVTGEDPRHEVVQHESFAPVLVVQHADSFEHALALCNGVRQGLAAALFGAEPAQRERFAATVRAGIIKFDDSTVDADAEHPFGGWKRSGVGPPEHGVGAREFFTRWQTRYDGPAGR